MVEHEILQKGTRDIGVQRPRVEGELLLRQRPLRNELVKKAVYRRQRLKAEEVTKWL